MPLCSRLAGGGGGNAAGVTVHVRKDSGSFHFERLLDFFVVFFRKLSRAKFEAQVAQILVNRIAALHQLIELGAMRRGIRWVAANAENKQKHRGSEQRTREGDRDIHATHRIPCPIHAWRARAFPEKLLARMQWQSPTDAASVAPLPTTDKARLAEKQRA